jgi:hypothetical protein
VNDQSEAYEEYRLESMEEPMEPIELKDEPIEPIELKECIDDECTLIDDPVEIGDAKSKAYDECKLLLPLPDELMEELINGCMLINDPVDTEEGKSMLLLPSSDKRIELTNVSNKVGNNGGGQGRGQGSWFHSKYGTTATRSKAEGTFKFQEAETVDFFDEFKALGLAQFIRARRRSGVCHRYYVWGCCRYYDRWGCCRSFCRKRRRAAVGTTVGGPAVGPLVGLNARGLDGIHLAPFAVVHILCDATVEGQRGIPP